MVEARDVRMGQWGFSNQVAHHVPWMYLYAGQPWRTQEIVREVLARMYGGSEIGRGYPGDEDNGETSAWWLFAALGFYPLQMGSDQLVIGSPLFTRAMVHLDNGRTLEISAPGNNAGSRYVAGVTVNGKPWGSTAIPHSLLAQGGRIEFEMSSKPTTWEASPRRCRLHLTSGERHAHRRWPISPVAATESPRRASRGADVAVLFDDTSATEMELACGAPVTLSYTLANAPEGAVTFYTLTSGSTGSISAGVAPGRLRPTATRGNCSTSARAKPSSGRATRGHSGWPSRPRYRQYRLVIEGGAGQERCSLAEVELLAASATPRAGP